MKKRYLLGLCLFVIIGIRLSHENSSETILKDHPKLLAKTQAKKVEERAFVPEVDRLPAQVDSNQIVTPPSLVKPRFVKASANVEHLEEYGLYEEFKDLPRGMILASHLKAVSKNEFSSNLGKMIKEQGGMIYFRPHDDRSEDSWNHVVYDSKTRKLYPLSTVIKVLDISDAQRSELVSKGLEEYYYHDGLQLFYTQSSNTRLISQVQELKKMGHEVELEVVINSVRKR